MLGKGLKRFKVFKGFNAAGLPLSFELSAARFNEAAVLQLGHAWQRVTDHHLRQPALPQ